MINYYSHQSFSSIFKFTGTGPGNKFKISVLLGKMSVGYEGTKEIPGYAKNKDC